MREADSGWSADLRHAFERPARDYRRTGRQPLPGAARGQRGLPDGPQGRQNLPWVYSSSACSADWAAREYGLERASIPLLHTGVDTRHFSPSEVPGDVRPTIVFAGKLTWNKGVLVLLKAALKLAPSFPGLRVRMLGRGEKHVVAELRRQAAAAGHEDLLEMPGFVDRDRLPKELRPVQVFAAPSRYEGGPGFVYLEAMACGLPVIACAGSGVAEIVVEGVNGLLGATR